MPVDGNHHRWRPRGEHPARVVVTAAVGLALIAAALVVPSRVLGVTLAIEGLVLLAAAGGALRFSRLAPGERLLRAHAAPGQGRIGRSAALAVLGAITAVALGLRLANLDSDLWLDEIVTVRDYATLPATEIVRTYGAANNHLLNSLLVHWSIDLFGYRDWAVRLSPLVAGVLTVPATYWVARITMRRAPALAAAAVVSVAYQHVFFSQNARGYALSMLFAVLSSGLLIQALRTDRLERWALYVACAVLCVAAVPTGAFVVAGQGLVAIALLARAVLRGDRAWPAARRLLAVFGSVGLLVLQVYAGVIARALEVSEAGWASGEAGFAPLSRAFLSELGRSAGLGGSSPTSVVALALGALGVLGLVSLSRRDAALVAALALGPLLHMAFASARGLVFSPRFLALWLFPAVLVAVETVDIGAAWVGRRRPRAGPIVFCAGAALLCLVVASPFRFFFGVPKQRYREAIEYAEGRRGDGLVVAVYTAEAGLRYYAVEHGGATRLVEGKSFAVARTAEQLDAIVADAGARPLVLVTTFERGLREGRPRLAARVGARWRRSASFDGSIDGGDVSVWVPRPSATGGGS